MPLELTRQLRNEERESLVEEASVLLLLFDAYVRHQIFMLRHAEWVTAQAVDTMEATQAKVRKAIVAGMSISQRVDVRLRAATETIAELRGIRSDGWRVAGADWRKSLDEFMGAESTFNRDTIERVLPVQYDTKPPRPEAIQSAKKLPVEGKTPNEWMATVRNNDLDRLSVIVRRGAVQGQSPQQVAKEALDQLKTKTARDIRAVTRTVMNSLGTEAQKAVAEANKDIIDRELYVATLDARTTPICRSLDGKTFPLGEGPHPPVHFQCRSLRVPLVTEEAIGFRPFKPTTEKLLLAEYTKEANLKKVQSRDALPGGHKRAFERWARRRVRERIGRVPAKVTYQEWLKTQSKAFQDEVLGPTRAKLFRKGGLSLDRFVSKAGDEIPLDKLRKLEAQAFKAAGL